MKEIYHWKVVEMWEPITSEYTYYIFYFRYDSKTYKANNMRRNILHSLLPISKSFPSSKYMISKLLLSLSQVYFL